MRKRQSEAKIYEVALKQFAKRGYKKTTLDDIAEKLNMTNANLYSYASSKQALYHDCVAYALTKWQNRVVEALTGIDDPIELLLTLCDRAVLYLSEDKVFCQILRNDPEIFPMFPTVDPYEEINKNSYNMLRDTLQNGVASGQLVEMDVDKTAHILFAIYKALIIETYIRDDNENFINTYNETRNMIMYGLIKKK